MRRTYLVHLGLVERVLVEAGHRARVREEADAGGADAGGTARQDG
jgi:hypothetical protein